MNQSEGTLLDRNATGVLGVIGIGMDDLARIQRDEFAHYMNVARVTYDPQDWEVFRPVLLNAINAAFGLGLDTTCRRGACGDILELLDDLSLDFDPANRWPEFMEEVWDYRHAIRSDLE